MARPASRRPRDLVFSYRARAWLKAAGLALVVGGACVVNLATTGAALARPPGLRGAAAGAAAGTSERRRRRLGSCPARRTDPDKDDCPTKSGWGITIGWVFVVLYLFLGTAIICDELFVPALEVIAEKWGLSDDVAGATLMAAGGSAPELATSFIGTFQRSAVGFGTIVGSAVFNVLFVIGMCAIFTPKELAPLQLTWWPLFRDCMYYALTLITLGGFFAMGGPFCEGQILWWEALVQFCLYLGYVGIMAMNEQLERHVKTKWLGLEMPPDDEAGSAGSAVELRERVDPDGVRLDGVDAALEEPRNRRTSSRPANFRAGIGRILMGQSADFLLQSGVVAVTQIAGDVDATFDQLDADHSGELDLDELGALLKALAADGASVDASQVDALRAEIDADGTGTVRREAFRVWYLASETRLRNETRALFDSFDTDRSGDIDLGECEAVLAVLEERWGVQARCGSAKELLDQMAKGGSRATFAQFHQWYQSSVFYERAKAEAELQAETTKSMWQTTVENVRGLGDASAREKAVVLVTLPLNALLGATVPDCTVPGNEKWCYGTFVASICWIGGFAFLMVRGIEIIGAQIGVPVFIMALTFLAAGTSVPDLLSSVVVAKQGKGDMAVSSSIGSNIFDVAVGLPLPWLFYTIIFDEPVTVGGQGVGISIGILLFMVLCVVFSVMASGWKMSRGLGAAMFGLYVLYVAQEILRAAIKKQFGC